jgi:hypothetical protein
MSILSVPVIAFDPSSTKIGWALLGNGPAYIASNVCYLPATAPPDERVLMVGPAITSIINDCRQRSYAPAVALIEIPDFVADYAKPHIATYFRAAGVAEYAAHLCGLHITRVVASKEKRKSRKQENKDRFLQIVRRYALDDDESDAFCLGWDYLTELMAAASART